MKMKTKLDGIRLPSGSDDPPSWSKKVKTYKRRQPLGRLSVLYREYCM